MAGCNMMPLTDQQFRQLLGDHLPDQRVEQILRDDREALKNEARLARDRVSEREWALENRLMEMEAKV